MTVEVHRSPLLEGLPHGFLGRRGGISQGVHRGLNVGYGSEDEREAIRKNRRIAAEAIAPGARLVTVHQVHGDACVTAGAWPDTARPPADALVTDRLGFLLGILTADCAPVLFADREAGVIGAAHAGWRGALAGITDSTIAAMEALGARRNRIRAAVGPCIAVASYKVDASFRDHFLDADPANHQFFTHGPRFDLAGYVLHRLRATDIDRAEALGLDTYSDEQGFYSFRRATHRAEPDYGRQLSAIALP